MDDVEHKSSHLNKMSQYTVQFQDLSQISDLETSGLKRSQVLKRKDPATLQQVAV